MKMYKTAQSDDNIVVRITTNKQDGTFKSTILGHTGEATCSDGLDAALLKYILETEIDGFGNMAEITGEGDTGEVAAPHAVPQAIKAPSVTVEEEAEDEEDIWSVQTRKDQGLGFGV
jgi:hypothetical protein